MTNSMKDLLLGLGFKSAPQQEAPKRPAQQRTAPKREQVAAGRDARRDAGDAAHRAGQRHVRNDTGAGPSQRRSPQHLQHRPQQRGAAHAHGPGAQWPAGGRDPHPDRAPRQKTREEIDLAKAYAMRAQKEKDERIEAERLKQEAARIKREAKAQVAELLKDKSLNVADAELTRHFDYNGKIRRVHVNEMQLKALNAGELGVVQLDGRYLLVDAALAHEVHARLPSLVALLVDPQAPVAEDPYADPKYAIPDDLVW